MLLAAVFCQQMSKDPSPPQSASPADVEGPRELRVARSDTQSEEQLAELETAAESVRGPSHSIGCALSLWRAPAGQWRQLRDLQPARYRRSPRPLRPSRGCHAGSEHHPRPRPGTRPAISGTYGWRGSGPANSTGFASLGPYAPHEGHRFNPDKLVVDPYATAIASAPGLRLSPGLRLRPVIALTRPLFVRDR